MNDFNLWEKVRLPPELLARLDAMIRRVRILQLARGLLATLGVALASILVVMGVDAALVIPSDAVRWGLSLAGLALTLLTAYIALWRPLADRLTPVRMARIVETHAPSGFETTLVGARPLLGGAHGIQLPVERMRAAVGVARDANGLERPEPERVGRHAPQLVSPYGTARAEPERDEYQGLTKRGEHGVVLAAGIVDDGHLVV